MRLRFSQAVVGVLAALGALVIVVTVTPLVSWWAAMLAGPWEDPSGDVLIVLGGASDDDGVMGQTSYLRSNYAVRAFEEGGFKEVLLSGGGVAGRSIAESMRDYVQYRGLPATVVHVERESRTTRENALFCKPILEKLPGRKVLMTSDYHMKRAYLAFTRAGIEVVARPIPDVIKRAGSFWNRWDAFTDLVRETAALGYYFLRGWL